MDATTTKSPVQVVLDYVDALNRGDLDAVARCFAPDARVWMVLGWVRVADVKEAWREQVETLGMNLQVDEIVEEGGTVAVRCTERGASASRRRAAATRPPRWSGSRSRAASSAAAGAPATAAPSSTSSG